LIERLLGLQFEESARGPQPYRLVFDAEAKNLWRERYNQWGRVQAEVEGDLRAALAKLEGGAARLAALHHVVTFAGSAESDRCPVTVDSLAAGIALADWFAKEAERVYAMLAETPAQRSGRKLVEQILAHGGRISVRQLQRSNSRQYPSSEDAKADLEGLVRSGAGRWLPGGKSRMFELYPTFPTHDTSDT
jgi:hypothetical protein